MAELIPGLSGISIPGVSPDIWNSIAGALFWIGLLILAIIGISIFIMWRRGAWIFKKFLTPTIVFYTLANGPKVLIDQLRFYKDKDKDMMELKSGDYRGPKFPDKELMYGDIAIMVVPEIGEAHTAEVKMDKVQLRDKDGKVFEKNLLDVLPLIKHDSKIAFINEFAESDRRFKLASWIEKYGIYLVFIIVVIFSFLIIQGGQNTVAQGYNQLTQGSEQMASALNRFADAMNKTGYMVPGGG